MNSDDFASIIEETRSSLRKRRGWFRRVYGEDLFTIIPQPGDDLRSHIDHQRLLLKRGKVVWAALVQANSLLYEMRLCVRLASASTRN
jgi:hypothetical protein